MNVKTIGGSVLALAVFVAACSSAPESTELPAEPGQASAATVPETGATLEGSELPADMTLILGMFQLATTDVAVDATQAAELLPLWRAYSSLSSSDTAAQAEIDAVVNQIEGLMSAEQIQAIDAMGLTQEHMAGLVEELGVVPELDGDFTPPEGLTRPEGFEGFEEGFDPAEFEAAAEELGLEGDFGAGAGQFLINPLIEMLEELAGS